MYFRVIMWIARDKNGALLLFRFFPKRLLNSKNWRRDNNTIVIDDNRFYFLKCEDEPIEVNIFSDKMIQEIKNDWYQSGYESIYGH